MQALGDAFSDEARQVIEKLLTVVPWAKAGRVGGAMDRVRGRTMHARLLQLRSHDRLTRTDEVAAAYEDLDAAIGLSPFTMRGSNGVGSQAKPIHIPEIDALRALRAPKHLSAGRLDEARADFEAASRTASADDPMLHTDLYALAAIHLRQGDAPAGLACYERACVADLRYRHLYGASEAPSSSEAAAAPAAGEESAPPLPVLEYFMQIAHAAFSDPTAEPVLVVEAFDVHSVRGVEGLPPQEVAAYMDALASAAAAR